MDNSSPSMLRSTLLAGALFGALGGIPFVRCACCLLVVACGFLAAYLYSGQCREKGAAFRPGMGALVGLIAGAFYAVASTLVGGVSTALVGHPDVRWILEQFSQMPNVPPEAQDQIDKTLEQLSQYSFSVLDLVGTFFKSILVGAIFSTVGGLIGGALFKVEPVAPPPLAGSPPA